MPTKPISYALASPRTPFQANPLPVIVIMKQALLLLSIVLMLIPLLPHAQDRKLIEFETVELPCFTLNDTIKFHLPRSFKKEKISWYGEGFLQAYTSESGSQLVIICGGQHAIPVLQGKQYRVTSQAGRKREGTKRRTSYLWREEGFLGFTIFYEDVRKDEKALFDSIMDEILAQAKKE